MTDPREMVAVKGIRISRNRWPGPQSIHMEFIIKSDLIHLVRPSSRHNRDIYSNVLRDRWFLFDPILLFIYDHMLYNVLDN